MSAQETHQSLAQKLASTAYKSPKIHNPNTGTSGGNFYTEQSLAPPASNSKDDWKELEAQLAYLRGESRACRGCEGPLLPGQPDGAYCKRCAQELAGLETDEYRSELFALSSATCFVLGGSGGHLSGGFDSKSNCVPSMKYADDSKVSDDMKKYLDACEKYDREMDKRGTWRHRVAVFFANIWRKIWLHVVFLVCTSSLALGLCAVEVPDAIIRALVHVESGAKWVDTGDIVGGWKRGNAGEISHFQLSGAAIHDMGAAKKTSRIASYPVLAESLARLWLSRCYERAGNWPDALSRYNAGSRYRGRTARDYAARIISLSSL